MIIHDHATIALQVVAMTTILRLGHAHIVPMATETGTAITSMIGVACSRALDTATLTITADVLLTIVTGQTYS